MIFNTGDLVEATTKKRWVKNNQVESEWQSYQAMLNESGLLNCSKLIDIKGNHDQYGVPSINSKFHYYRNYSACGNLYPEGVIPWSTSYKSLDGASQNVTVLLADATTRPGQYSPFGSTGDIYSQWSKNVTQIRLPHIATSFLGAEFLDVGCPSWRDNGGIRLIAVDNELISYLELFPTVPGVKTPHHDEKRNSRYTVEQHRTEWIIPTNPPSSKHITAREQWWKSIKSTHIRALCFTQLSEILSVRVTYTIPVTTTAILLPSTLERARPSLYHDPPDPEDDSQDHSFNHTFSLNGLVSREMSNPGIRKAVTPLPLMMASIGCHIWQLRRHQKKWEQRTGLCSADAGMTVEVFRYLFGGTADDEHDNTSRHPRPTRRYIPYPFIEKGDWIIINKALLEEHENQLNSFALDSSPTILSENQPVSATSGTHSPINPNKNPNENRNVPSFEKISTQLIPLLLASPSSFSAHISHYNAEHRAIFIKQRIAFDSALFTAFWNLILSRSSPSSTTRQRLLAALAMTDAEKLTAIRHYFLRQCGLSTTQEEDNLLLSDSERPVYSLPFNSSLFCFNAECVRMAREQPGCCKPAAPCCSCLTHVILQNVSIIWRHLCCLCGAEGYVMNSPFLWINSGPFMPSTMNLIVNDEKDRLEYEEAKRRRTEEEGKRLRAVDGELPILENQMISGDEAASEMSEDQDEWIDDARGQQVSETISAPSVPHHTLSLQNNHHGTIATPPLSAQTPKRSRTAENRTSSENVHLASNDRSDVQDTVHLNPSSTSPEEIQREASNGCERCGGCCSRFFLGISHTIILSTFPFTRHPPLIFIIILGLMILFMIVPTVATNLSIGEGLGYGFITFTHNIESQSKNVQTNTIVFIILYFLFLIPTLYIFVYSPFTITCPFADCFCLLKCCQCDCCLGEEEARDRTKKVKHVHISGEIQRTDQNDEMDDAELTRAQHETPFFRLDATSSPTVAQPARRDHTHSSTLLQGISEERTPRRHSGRYKAIAMDQQEFNPVRSSQNPSGSNEFNRSLSDLLDTANQSQPVPSPTFTAHSLKRHGTTPANPLSSISPVPPTDYQQPASREAVAKAASVGASDRTPTVFTPHPKSAEPRTRNRSGSLELREHRQQEQTPTWSAPHPVHKGTHQISLVAQSPIQISIGPDFDPTLVPSFFTPPSAVETPSGSSLSSVSNKSGASTQLSPSFAQLQADASNLFDSYLPLGSINLPSSPSSNRSLRQSSQLTSTPHGQLASTGNIAGSVPIQTEGEGVAGRSILFPNPGTMPPISPEERLVRGEDGGVDFVGTAREYAASRSIALCTPQISSVETRSLNPRMSSPVELVRPDPPEDESWRELNEQQDREDQPPLRQAVNEMADWWLASFTDQNNQTDDGITSADSVAPYLTVTTIDTIPLTLSSALAESFIKATRPPLVSTPFAMGSIMYGVFMTLYHLIGIQAVISCFIQRMIGFSLFSTAVVFVLSYALFFYSFVRFLLMRRKRVAQREGAG
ncbi:hypothetical protein BLNAU_17816 [Blattamonas nauphoetae]|uniref:Calcineurin-like phosphoesterase domain-containing protein n=1 Tax=Blattamonas nauphoetae TaxID=2049346 RepID=A0ABQ9X665_9EUKA|nr:hypothetical protein BLNAU_17816 [Blattamonas nauphoetae]